MGVQKFKKQKGITLIALIITIIIMIILAAVIISLMMSGGLLKQAERAKEETIRGEYRERLSIIAADEYIEKVVDGEILERDDMTERLKAERDSGREDWIKPEEEDGIKEDPKDEKTIKVISKEEYVFDVVVSDDGEVEIVDGDSEVPSDEKEIPTLDTNLETRNITFTNTPNAWTNGNVIVTIKTEIEGYTLEYSKTGNDGDWETYTSGVEYESNGIIHVRLTDGDDVSNVVTGTIENIDKLEPNAFEINAVSTTNTITCEVPTVTDSAATSTNGSSGIAKIEYKLDNEGTYSTETRIWTELTHGKNHIVYVKVTDNAGNTREISKTIIVGTVPVGTGNISFEYTPDTWTNGDVTVTINTTETGYTLQYSKNGTDWTNYTKAVIYEENGDIYARLTDGVNGGEIVTGNISNIDKIGPNVFEINVASTTNGITCEVPTVTDSVATSTNGSSGIAKIEYKLDEEGIYSTETRIWTELTHGTIHTVYVKATDNAGNIREISKTITVGTVPEGIGNILFEYNPNTWTNGNVVVTVNTTQVGYTLQYRKNGGTWTNYEEGIEYTENGTLDARLWDGNNGGEIVAGNITNIDRTSPVIGTITGTQGGGAFTATDIGSGIIEYGYSTSSNTEPLNWINVTATTNLEETKISGLKSNTSYYIWVKDQAENIENKQFTTTMPAEAEAPVLTGGLIPIKWDEGSWIDTTATDPEWYDYIEQTETTESGGTSKWANARTSNGSMLVWIPRYEYKILSGEHTNTAGEIDINFISLSQTEPTEGYIIHPSFTDIGNNGLGELKGIWVGKFESSNSGTNVRIVPNVQSWTNTNLSVQFSESQEFARNNSLNAYDSHMMKNTEWGAVAYFAHSKYGRNGTEITINNSSGIYTGRAGASISDSNYILNGTYTYETVQGQLASTTGNIYGVYDMSGGQWECVMGVYDNTVGSSGFKNMPDTKYFDNYTSYSNIIKGDAIYETSVSSGIPGWNEDVMRYVGSNLPWFARGR